MDALVISFSLISLTLVITATGFWNTTLERVPSEQPGPVSSQKQLAALINVQHYLSQKDCVQATESSKNAVTYTPNS